MAPSRTAELRALAEEVVDALPAVVEEVVLTGSVSREVADDVSDIEMLLVTTEELSLGACFEHAREAGLSELGTWGQRRFAERIERALTELEPHRALLTMAEVQADAAALAPSGPNVDRARAWLAEAIRILRDAQDA